MDNVMMTFSSSEGPGWTKGCLCAGMTNGARTLVLTSQSAYNHINLLLLLFLFLLSFFLTILSTMLSEGNKKGFEVSSVVSVDRLELMVQVWIEKAVGTRQ
jgi:cellulose synthase/poly-beta-1,6-N-acetylglucosamine synthase-like glycosyltransferase